MGNFFVLCVVSSRLKNDFQIVLLLPGRVPRCGFLIAHVMIFRSNTVSEIWKTFFSLLCNCWDWVRTSFGNTSLVFAFCGMCFTIRTEKFCASEDPEARFKWICPAAGMLLFLKHRFCACCFKCSIHVPYMRAVICAVVENQFNSRPVIHEFFHVKRFFLDPQSRFHFLMVGESQSLAAALMFVIRRDIVLGYCCSSCFFVTDFIYSLGGRGVTSSAIHIFLENVFRMCCIVLSY